MTTPQEPRPEEGAPDEQSQGASGQPPHGQQPPPHGQPPQYGQQPGYGQPPQYGQQPYGQPQFGQPQFGQPQFGQPQFGQPPYGQPQYGQPQYGQQYGQAQYGQPGYGPPQGFGPPPGYGAPPANRIDLSPAGIKAAYANAQPPKEAHQGFLAFVIAIGLNLLWSILGVVFVAIIYSGTRYYGGLGTGISWTIVGLVFWVIVSAVVLFLLVQMRAGVNWARITLAVLAGIGVIFGIFRMITSLGYLFFSAPLGVFAMVVALASMVFLIIAIVQMFRAPNGYFR